MYDIWMFLNRSGFSYRFSTILVAPDSLTAIGTGSTGNVQYMTFSFAILYFLQ